jgi:hypothetical protein
MNKRVIFEKKYHGFEDVYDLGRDMDEVLDDRFNPNAKGIPGEFQGIIKVTVEYIPAEGEE